MLRSTVPRRPVDTAAYPDALERAEAAQIAERRARAGVPTDPLLTPGMLPDDTVGVGLSGGGIRSATFALGLFQALALRKCLARVDVLSTVSGGGYFGSFLGRLFTRRWVGGVADVERVLLAEDPPAAADALPAAGIGDRVFRWLRDNGRYLAPRGSGDLLLLGAVLLRNWVAVHVVLLTTMLTVLVGAQAVRLLVEAVWGVTGGYLPPLARAIIVPHVPSFIWWSPWIATPLLPLLLGAVPSGWAYWLVSRERQRIRQVNPKFAAGLLLAMALAGVLYYTARAAMGGPLHGVRLSVCAAVAASAILTFVFYRRAMSASAHQNGATPSDAEIDNLARTTLSRSLSQALQATGVLLVMALVDTFGQTVYAVAEQGQLARWIGAAIAAFAAVGAFARPLWILVAPSRGVRPRIPLSILSWAGAVVVLGSWLLIVDIAAHAVRWQFHAACGVPADFFVTVACAPEPSWLSQFAFVVVAGCVLAIFTYLFGNTRIFANLSSAQGFYAARLIRTFLGASNDRRHGAPAAQPTRRQLISEPTAGDDIAGERYWIWPSRSGSADRDDVRPWHRGGPLHIVNATVNETYDVRTGIQNQDRKGTGLAVGPSGLSLGVRHHLVSGDAGWAVFPQAHDTYRVFSETPVDAPEALSLGRWMSISGAAFTTAAGSMTTVPMAILAGMFNVRLGYWWDSGVQPPTSRWLDRVLPVQSAFIDEMFARTRGTACRLWNLSDGGHFENMGGYELIRRRLPIIVIVDAEADPDYTFDGLAALVRKARLDFGAEVRFLNAEQLDCPPGANGPHPAPPFPETVRRYFGDLDALRRGEWLSERLTDVEGTATRRYTLAVDRTRPSQAHAALARVVYGKPGDVAASSWLVYVKATLTGDEPEDVCHYHRSHPDFPQEPTSDQFFDEAQWESYRRLGQHIGDRVLTTELFEYLRAHPAAART